MLLGLICILLSGLTTIGFGVIFNYIGTKYDFKNTMLMYAVFTLFLCAGISFFESGSWATFAILPMLFAFLSGVCNIIGLIAMQKAMSIGNAGVAWAFCQAGLLGPFLFSIVYSAVSTVSSTEGSLISICWNLRVKLLFFAT